MESYARDSLLEPVLRLAEVVRQVASVEFSPDSPAVERWSKAADKNPGVEGDQQQFIGV